MCEKLPRAWAGHCRGGGKWCRPSWATQTPTDSAGAGAGTQGRAGIPGLGCGVSRRVVMARRQMPWLQSQPSSGWCVTSEQVLICSGPQGAAVRSEGGHQYPLCCGQETDGHYLLTLAAVAILRVFLDPHLFYIPEQEQSEPGCWPSPREARSGPSACSGLTQVSEVPQCLGGRVQPGETLGRCPQPARDTRHLQALASPCGPGLGSVPSAQNSPALMAEFQVLWWAALLCPLICRKYGGRD